MPRANLALPFVMAALLGGCTSAATSSPLASPSPSPSAALGSPSSGSPSSGSPSSAPSTVTSGPTVVAMGTFHRVDGDATGTVALEHLADGSFSIVFEDFKIASAQHTNVVLVPNADVIKDTDVDPKKIVDLGPLTGTTGMQDYKVPAEMAANAMTYHTVVLWDTAMTHAIAAAPLAAK